MNQAIATYDTTSKNCKEAYPFGFNGQERKDDYKGKGNHNHALYWEYDTRIGRRWNLDPVDQISISNYAVFANSPIWVVDPLGDRITAKSDWTTEGKNGGMYSHLNNFMFNAWMGKDDPKRNCALCCLNALTTNLNYLYGAKMKVQSSYDLAMKQVGSMGYRGDREIAKPTFNGKVVTSSTAPLNKADWSSANFKTGIVDNLQDQMNGNSGTYMFGVGIAQGYHSTIVMGMNNGQVVSNVIGADGKVIEGDQTATGVSPIFGFIEDGGGVRFFNAEGLENKMKEYVIGAAKYYSGKKSVDGRSVSNTLPKDISSTVDNLEYKKE